MRFLGTRFNAGVRLWLDVMILRVSSTCLTAHQVGSAVLDWGVSVQGK